ncbi:MAG TPA: hypothetical protein VK817_26560 [Trebonia sp.]|jgi:hypothetical protein|nr:hypothetical protein [Trebonia sp.]
MKHVSLFAIAAVIVVAPLAGSLAAVGTAAATTAGATTAGVTTTALAAHPAAAYFVTTGHATRLNQSASVSALPTVQPGAWAQLAAVRGTLPTQLSGDSPGSADAAGVSSARARAARMTAVRMTAVQAKAAAAAAPSVTPWKVAAASGHAPADPVVHAFNGVSDKDSDALIDSPITPPDQGLCVGRDNTLPGRPDAVWEPVNEAAQETTKTGVKLRPDVGLTTIFQDPYFIGDVRCLYDPSSETFYFTEIGYPVAAGPSSDGNNTVVDVAVVNARGAAEYQFDTSLDGACFGDQPKTGFDDNALVISTDEYCGTTESDYEGAITLVISKPELAAEDTTVADDVLGPVSLAGDPVTGLDPAIDTGSGTEYLVNSVPFTGSDQAVLPVDNTLGLWTLTNTASVTTGHGMPELTSKVLTSEPYAFPVNATSTGNGSTTTVNGTTVTSETYLEPDDSRLSGPVNVTRAPGGGVDLWTALDAAVTPRGSSTAEDAAAWFEISTARQAVVGQGYIAAKNANLLYPAIETAPGGPAAAVFTITSATIQPSVAYAFLGSPDITTVAHGSGPHLSFADPDNRWGDYSFAVLDPDGSGIWLASEYIPPAAAQDPYDNWGTYVFEIARHGH